MTDPRLTPLARTLPATVPFVGPETQERARGLPFAARLGANESVFGPSPAAIEAMCRAAPEAWMYGDPEMLLLRQAIATHHEVPIESVMVGEGIDGLLGTLVRLYVASGDPVVTSQGAYPTFAYHVAGFGGQLHTVPYKQDAEDLDALVERTASVGAKLVYFANPDNPMGSWLPASRIMSALEHLPEGALLVLDEAYADFAPRDAIPEISPEDRRVIRFRTFSKAHGLAGLRVGYAIAHPDVVAAFNKVRNHFGVGRLAQEAALASLGDTEHLAATVAKVSHARDEIRAIGAASGLVALPSATNFVSLDCGQDGAFARRVLNALVDRGIFVRMPSVAPLDRTIRISCGPPETMKILASALPDALNFASHE